MKKILLICLVCGSSVALRAQSLTPIVVSTSGAFFSNGAGMLSTTIGELAAVTTLTGGSNYLTQGFQQPWDFSVSVPEIHDNGLAFDLYPNPSSGMITLSMNTDQASKVTLQVFDVLGKSVYFEALNHSSGYASHDVNLKALAEGVYLLEVTNTELSSGKVTKSIKKINLAY